MKRTAIGPAELARESGVSLDVIKKLRSRTGSSTNAEAAARIAAHFGKSVAQFLDNEEEPGRGEVVAPTDTISAKDPHSLRTPARALVGAVATQLPLNIRTIRQARGMTLAQLANDVGVSTPHISQIERGIKNLNNNLLTRIASALDVTPADLIAAERSLGVTMTKSRPVADTAIQASNGVSKTERSKLVQVIASRIEAELTRRGMNPAELGREAGLGATGVYDILSGKSGSPRIDTIEKIADALGVSASSLFGEVRSSAEQPTFRSALLWHLKHHDSNLADISRGAGVSHNQLKQLARRDTSSTNVENAIKIAAFFGKSVEQFVRCQPSGGESVFGDLIINLTQEERRIVEAMVRALLSSRATN